SHGTAYSSYPRRGTCCGSRGYSLMHPMSWMHLQQTSSPQDNLREPAATGVAGVAGVAGVSHEQGVTDAKTSLGVVPSRWRRVGLYRGRFAAPYTAMATGRSHQESAGLGMDHARLRHTHPCWRIICHRGCELVWP